MLIPKNRAILYPNYSAIPKRLEELFQSNNTLPTSKKISLLMVLEGLFLMREANAPIDGLMKGFEWLYMKHGVYKMEITGGDDEFSILLKFFLEIYKSKNLFKLSELISKIKNCDVNGESYFKIEFEKTLV